MKHAIAHVALVVREYDEAIAFYTETLGFTLVEDTYQPEQDKRWVIVAPSGTSGSTLLLARASTPEQAQFIGNQAGGRVFLFLSTDDFWRDYHRMIAAGVRFVRPPSVASYGTVAVFEDLYGNRWDLIEYGASTLSDADAGRQGTPVTSSGTPADMHPRAAELIATLKLHPHPEGGFYREIFRSPTEVAPADDRGPRAALTTIYFLLREGDVSRWHQVTSDEVWHLYEGGPLELLELDGAGRGLVRHRLGHIGSGADAPVCTIRAGQWQAARSLSAYALVGCTVGPGFDFADFRLLADDPERSAVVRKEWPDVAELI